VDCAQFAVKQPHENSREIDRLLDILIQTAVGRHCGRRDGSPHLNLSCRAAIDPLLPRKRGVPAAPLRSKTSKSNPKSRSGGVS